jgi:hypothetical protein
MAPDDPVVAVLVPCYNEASTVVDVVTDLKRWLPDAKIYVYDNASTDDTGRLAEAAGAIVQFIPLRGKGNVVRRMFADIEADVYVLIDGDGTYDASGARQLVTLVDRDGFDLVNARRIADADQYSHPQHQFGNRALSWLVRRLFGQSDLDILSGYKALSRRFVKSLPMFASGFELETELTVHALDLSMPIESIPLPYRARPTGSESKLSTYKDGTRIMRTIAALLRRERPLAFFGVIAFLLTVLAVILGIPLVSTYFHTHRVPRFPTAFLVVGLIVLAVLVAISGLILDTVTRGRKETKMLSYLALEGPLERRERRTASSGVAKPPHVTDRGLLGKREERQRIRDA